LSILNLNELMNLWLDFFESVCFGDVLLEIGYFLYNFVLVSIRKCSGVYFVVQLFYESFNIITRIQIFIV
jgi:hypothetical protein